MFNRDGEAFKKLQQRFRRKRFRHIEAMIRRLLETRSEVKILDAGGRAIYWRMLAPDLRSRVRITVLNYDAELAPDDVKSGDGLRIEKVVGDACDMPQYADGCFDIVHANSVIEHVGSYHNMIRFANEVRRVGQNYYVQTPHFWFPVDPHYGIPFFHWLPDSMRAYLFSSFRIGARSLNNMFPDGDHRPERFMLLWTKSLIVSRQGA
ncbi:methyltransferase domain-containing protein [Sphingobium estronivorans]|uniref:methyltransferase domain-containing protein n=1 Tax=Sphingobium estronivorans TaxID=1577690 RepID=UPI001238AA77|nr:methyltransferase domain-containing protein [Sphingobium estronivorans]